MSLQKKITKSFIYLTLVAFTLSSVAKPPSQSYFSSNSSSSFQPLEVASLIAQADSRSQVTISFIEQEDEAQFLREFSERSDQNLVVFHNGARDSVHQLNKSKLQLVDLSDKDFTQGSSKKHTLWQKVKGLRNPAVGVLIATGTSGIFAAPFYFTSGLDMASQLFGAALVINTFQGVFTKQWQDLLSLGARGGSALQAMVLKVFNAASETSARAQNLGTLGAALTFNLGAATLFLDLSGTLTSAWAVMALATLGLYDATWDMVITQLQRKDLLSYKTTQKFVRVRMMFGALLDSLAINFGAPAQLTMGLLTVTGIASLFNVDQVARGLAATSAKRQYFQEMKASRLGLKGFLPRLRKTLGRYVPQADPCRQLLNSLQSH